MPRRRPPSTPSPASPSPSTSIAGYTATQLPGPSSSSPWIYLRPHATDVLFLANLPPSTTAAALRSAVPGAAPGPDAVAVHPTPGCASGTSFGRVRMADGAAGVARVLADPSEMELSALAEARREGGGVKDYWAARDEGAVARWAGAAMATFERGEDARRERERAEDAAGGVADEDGFVKVGRGRKGVGMVNERVAERHGVAKKKKAKGVEPGMAPDGFYRWQRREGRKKELQDLRKRFEGDKKRVAEISALRMH